MKLIVIAAGIPELGKENADAHIHVGRLLDTNADVIILMRSIFYSQLAAQISKGKIHAAYTKEEAWNVAQKYNPKEYVILLLPGLTDLYY
jgi:UDP-N-acetylmuramyl pentapeptide synthase